MRISVSALLLACSTFGWASDCDNIKKHGDGFYTSSFKKNDTKMSLVMEQVTDGSLPLWRDYISVQANERSVAVVRSYRDKDGKALQGGSLSDGSRFFKKVLKHTSHTLCDIFIAYITRSAKPIRIPDSVKYYSVENVEEVDHDFASQIEMFVTVVSSPNALITSHMGIAATLESVGRRERGLSLILHSFAAQVMLMRNPKLRLMVNAPVFAMEKLILNALPKATFIGTREMDAEVKRCQNLTYDEYKKKMETEQKLRIEKMQSVYARKTGQVIRDDVQYVIPPIPEAELLEGFYLEKYNPCSLRGMVVPSHCYDQPSSQNLEDIANLLDKHPAILSVTKEKGMIIFDPDNPEKVLIETSKSADCYGWLKDKAFLPAGRTHYFAVDLSELAKYGQNMLTNPNV